MPITSDARIKFNQTIALDGPSAIVCVEVFGGAIVAVQVGLFDDNDNLLGGVGVKDGDPVLTSEADGSANWPFKPPAGLAYVKWGVVAIRSAAGLGHYSVTGKVRDANGNTLVSGRFAGVIPEGDLNDTKVEDGVNVSTPRVAALAAGRSL